MNMVDSARASFDTPAPLYLPPRRLMALLALPFVVFTSISAVLWMPHVLALITGGGSVLRVVMTLLGLAIGVPATMGCARAAFFQGPALVVDGDGVHDRRRHGKSYAWTEIARAQVGGGRYDRLLIRLRGRDRGSELRRFVTTLQRVNMQGSDTTIYLGNVKFDRRELERALDQHQRAAARANASGTRWTPLAERSA